MLRKLLSSGPFSTKAASDAGGVVRPWFLSVPFVLVPSCCSGERVA